MNVMLVIAGLTMLKIKCNIILPEVNTTKPETVHLA